MKKLFSALLLAAIAAACSSSGTQTSESPSGLQAVLASIDEDISGGTYGYIDHFLVIKDDSVIYDQAYSQDYSRIMYDYDTSNHQYNYDHPDWHPFLRKTKLHTLQSVTKSVNSLLLGIAIDEGLIPGVDQSINNYLSSYPGSSEKTTITIEDLLTMRSGILWDEENYDLETNSCIIMEGSDDWIKYVLEQPLDTIPGTSFEYNSGASVLLGKIVSEATGMSVDTWAEEKLFGPLGITEYYWKKTPRGEVDTEGGLYLSTHDLARIGKLVMDGGMFNGKRVISEDWIMQSTTPHVVFNENSGYGYQWWVPGISPKIIAGNGYGGQFLFIVPDQNLILVFNGWNIHDRPEKSSFDVLQDRILPIIQAE